MAAEDKEASMMAKSSNTISQKVLPMYPPQVLQLQAQKSHSRSLSSAGIQIEKARNLSFSGDTDTVGDKDQTAY